MKVQRAPLEIFTLSFLDIISCAFAAIVMLVLLSKNGEQGEHQDVSQMADLLRNMAQVESQIVELKQSLTSESESLQQLNQQTVAATRTAAAAEKQLAATQTKTKQLADDAEALQDVLVVREKAATQATSQLTRDEAVGGIPVDSEYVIFIVDTSGSMRRIWHRLLKEMDNILDIHPKVKGFQVMNDMGTYLLSNFAGKWIKDSPKVRKQVLDNMKSWYDMSNSSPVEGIEVALRTYAKPGASLAIYILGDEYSGGSYDPVLAKLNQLNTDPKTGERIARVHAIGFVSGQPTNRFSTLMRAVTEQNRGTFLALPK